MISNRPARMLVPRVIVVSLLALASPAVAQDAPNGEAIYMQSCAGCHGKNLEGGNAKSMVDGAWQFGARRSDLFRNTKFGIESAGMPAYADGLTDPQINAVVDYLLVQEKRASPGPKIPKEIKTRDYTLDVTVVASDLNEPWGITFVSPTHALVTEKAGPIRQVIDGKLLPEPVRDTPRTQVMGQGGMMDVAVDPDFATNGWIYLAYSHPRGDQFTSGTPAMTRIVRGKIKDNAWTEQQVLWEAKPEHYRNAGVHFGCRIVFDPQGHLYFAIGDRGAQDMAQDITRPNGKSHRIHRDGSIPKDNPFVGTPDAYESIYTFGNRNIQGLAVHPLTGQVWATEHGPMGGDELNLLKPGRNYGWPIITYGQNYNGTPITKITEKQGLEQPNIQWTPSPALCGLDFYSGTPLAKWQNSLLVGALKFEEIKRVELDGERVVGEETILKNAGRVRDVQTGPDGAIYVILNQPGLVLRLAPR